MPPAARIRLGVRQRRRLRPGTSRDAVRPRVSKTAVAARAATGHHETARDGRRPRAAPRLRPDRFFLDSRPGREPPKVEPPEVVEVEVLRAVLRAAAKKIERAVDARAAGLPARQRRRRAHGLGTAQRRPGGAAGRGPSERQEPRVAGVRGAAAVGSRVLHLSAEEHEAPRADLLEDAALSPPRRARHGFVGRRVGVRALLGRAFRGRDRKQPGVDGEAAHV
mmetsp:Transcript_22666/g.70078  ORF Transcript_22666/g.70078 Transcript_22666/m.70078 type:complete len:222 (-) Transcript_22666:227-892(-)